MLNETVELPGFVANPIAPRRLPEAGSRRLTLRPVEAGDARATAALMTPGISARLTTWPERLGTEEAARRIAASVANYEAGRWIDLAVVDRADGELMGWVGLGFADADARGLAWFGYWLGEPYQRQGIMSAALQVALPMAYAWLKPDAIEARVYPGNIASLRLLGRLGFVASGFQTLYSPVRHVDEVIMRFRLPDAALAALRARAYSFDAPCARN